MDIDKLIDSGKHFCVLPWIHFHAWPDGKVMPCCVADSDQPVSEVKGSIMDIMNSPEYRRVRLEMLDDEGPAECKRCYDLEANGTWTLRNSQNSVRGERARDIIASTGPDGSIPDFKMLYMDIRFSNLCNFKCRSCGPGCSNLWGDEELERMGPDQFSAAFGGTDTLVSNNSGDKFLTELKPYLNDVEEVYMAGGEILVTPEHYAILQHWIDTGHCKSVKLMYTTNMSKLDHGGHKLFDYWKHFPNIEVWASLDAMGEVAELVRSGTRWEKVEANLIRIRDDMPNVNLQITPTISIWNVFDYPRLFDWVYENKLVSNNLAPRVNILTHPDHAQIAILPDYIRLELIRMYKDYVGKYAMEDDEISSQILDGFRVIVQTLWQGAEDSNKLREFFADQEVVDNIRSESITGTIPKLAEVQQWLNSQK